MTTLWSWIWKPNVIGQKVAPLADRDLLTNRDFYNEKRVEARAIIVEKRDTGQETVENQRKVHHYILSLTASI